jgi:hypothetical protein
VVEVDEGLVFFIVSSNVLKTRPDIKPVRVLGHWFIG